MKLCAAHVNVNQRTAGGQLFQVIKNKAELTLTRRHDPVWVCSAVSGDFTAAGVEIKARKGRNGRKKGCVFLPERLKSEEASSNHHGEVAAVRDHCARTGLLGIFAGLRGGRFSKTQLFTRESAAGV